jgi:hypothetical protein
MHKFWVVTLLLQMSDMSYSWLFIYVGKDRTVLEPTKAMLSWSAVTEYSEEYGSSGIIHCSAILNACIMA